MKRQSRVDSPSAEEARAGSDGRLLGPARRWLGLTAADEPELKTFSAIRAAYAYLSPYRARFAVMAILSLVGTSAEVGVLLVIGVAAHVQAGKFAHIPLVGQTVHASTAHLLIIGLGLVAIRLACFGGNAILTSRLSAVFEYTHRRLMIDGFLNARFDVQSTQRGGAFQSMLGYDLEAARSMIDLTAKALPAAIGFVVMLGGALLVSPVLALFVLGSTAVIAAILRPLSLLARAVSGRKSVVNAEMSDEIQQMIALAREIQVFGVSGFVRERTASLLREARRLRIRSDFLGAIVGVAFQNGVYMLALLALGLVLLIGGAARDSIAPVALLLIRSLSYSQVLQQALYTFVEREPYLRRLNERRAMFKDFTRRWGSRRLDAVERIEFDDVTFAYGTNPPALRSVTFSVDHGEAVAIVGPSGAGKSTLIQLLLGLFVPASGEVRVNGAPIHDFAEQEWAQAVSYVAQEPVLLRTSIAENIRFGRDISQEDVERAARLAYIADDIRGLPSGYDELAGERGARLSGGQRQRITIARALAADPKILVFDEPTSALDLVSEYAIRQTLEELRGKVNLFIISHRPATLELCDRVIVLNEGRLERFALLDDPTLESRFVRRAGSSTA